MVRQFFFSLSFVLLFGLQGCGGGNSTQVSVSTDGADPLSQAAAFEAAAASSYAGATLPPASKAAAARFLTLATFGPTPDAVNELLGTTYAAWVDKQLSLPPSISHESIWKARQAEMRSGGVSRVPDVEEFNFSFWRAALRGEDQLRQRVAFALSQIFVVSTMDGCATNNPQGLANYYDKLYQNAFGSYRELLEVVARHPVMGCYLSHLKNQKEDSLTGRVPDENFAREILQLFSIGLYELNADGTLKRDSAGRAIDTYQAEDIAGLAKVFTGFSYACPAFPADSCFSTGTGNGARYDDLWTRPMVGYPKFHSAASPKTFLGVTIAAQDQPDPDASLKAALDAIANRHANVAPFIAKQLIQRLVTSNPSEAYVARAAAAFNKSERNLGALVRAILIDEEARKFDMASQTAGKIREPILRLSAALRAVGAQSDSGRYLIDHSDDPATGLAQSPMRAPSVFNFYRPGYVHAGGSSARQLLVAPEMQITNETSVAGYINYMKDAFHLGVGRAGLDYTGTRRDIQFNYMLNDADPWRVAAQKTDSTSLLDKISDELMYGAMSPALRQEIKTVIDSLPLGSPTAGAYANNVKVRLSAALLLAVASPEFLVQR